MQSGKLLDTRYMRGEKLAVSLQELPLNQYLSIPLPLTPRALEISDKQHLLYRRG